jgi:hypothetical protein
MGSCRNAGLTARSVAQQGGWGEKRRGNDEVMARKAVGSLITMLAVVWESWRVRENLGG